MSTRFLLAKTAARPDCRIGTDCYQPVAFGRTGPVDWRTTNATSIFVAAFVPSVINTFSCVRQIDRPLYEASAMLNITGWRYWTQVLVPGALPSIFTGLRLSLQASWTTLVAAELVGAIAGLGQILNQGSQDIYPLMILVGLISVALAGWLITLALGWIEKKAMPWRSL